MAKVRDLQEFISLGRSIGVPESDILSFAQNERKLELELLEADRAERQAEREAQKADREKELELARIASERADKDLEIARLESERELARIESQKEIGLARLNRQADTSDNSSTSSSLDTPRNPVKPPQLPKFDERVDEIDSYITRFERHAQTVGWSQDDWATYLLSLLTGKALNTAKRYEVQVTKHYPSLREALLKSFEYTSDGYKGKFRTARIERGETYQLFGTRIKGYLNKWVQMSGAEQTFEGLLQLLLIDQLLDRASEGLTIFLKERNPTSWDQTLELAENYRLAHATRSLETSKSKHKGEEPSLGYMGSRSTPHANYATDKRVSPVGAVQEGRATAPKLKAGHKERGRKPVVWREEEGRSPIADGFLNGTPIKVLRDTGSSVVVVRSTLAPKRTGRFRWIKTIDSTMLKVATAMVQIDSPYFTGEVEAHLLDHPLYDCVVGNIPGAADPFQPNPNWGDSAKVTFEESEARSAKISSSAEVNGVIPPCSPI
ncbi:uncharacterized protein LOC129925943 [Biomphalaria glabrata]|uniref:Uncharacterized protein LOC129925940 n=1 Tax=Biomphalaria glabrata TaxID=6526 RepID=A0A9W3A888_BIOGL|nr:uncharacterized protein LOC129925940 [Biomphalaria glabrata]XP_055883515.1 uncharacterized protein LOC129925941 [Biomphalaria glabrata]XP_055883516.1 uncharacterized protein LOC129925942 [Biomphalaria glabrata]XP_055883517.1 uncharacterized protein LOC129925943 [Biomphalaria glabrata]